MSNPSADKPTTYTARWIVPIEGPPIENGCVVIVGERISAVGPRRSAEGTVVDYGDSVILPGFVNAHTHLEFSDLKQPLGVPGMPFADWIPKVIAYRRSVDFNAGDATLRGLHESTRCGVTTLGEIASADPFSWLKLQGVEADAVRVVVFAELLGLTDATAYASRNRITDFLRSSYDPPPNVRRGLSPHAPYTVQPYLLQAAISESVKRRIPLAFHLAESREELQLLRGGEGPLVEMLKIRNAWVSDAVPYNARPLDFLKALSRSARSLVIHGNYLDDEEIAFLSEHRANMSLVYCPRTHAYFGHSPHPLPKLLAVGANVALGTDGRCSNPDLSLHEEMRHVARSFPQLTPERIMRLGTIDGARALGLDQEVGSLTVGKNADLVALRIDQRCVDPHEVVLSSSAHVERVIFGGRVAFESTN